MTVHPPQGRANQSKVWLAPRIQGYAWARFLVSDEGDYDLEVEITAESMTAERAGGYRCSGLFVREREDGPPVTLAGIRKIPVADLVRRAAVQCVSIVDVERPGVLIERSADVPADLASEGPTDDTLKWVAFVYRMGLVQGLSPTKLVRETLGIPQSTAGRWVARARERGLLGESEGPGRAGG